MQGHILVSVMALLCILSTSAIHHAREVFLTQQLNQIQRDHFQLAALTDALLATTQSIILRLPMPIVPKEMHQCIAECVVRLQASDFFLEMPMSWWLTDNNPVIWPLLLPLQDMQAALVLEQLSTSQAADVERQYLRGTLVVHNQQGMVMRMQVYFERFIPYPLDYQQTAAELATLKSGSLGGIRRLAWRSV